MTYKYTIITNMDGSSPESLNYIVSTYIIDILDMYLVSKSTHIFMLYKVN